MGTVRVKVLPCPHTLVAVKSPPSKRAICREMASPRPVPPNFCGDGGVALLERLEEPGEDLLANADARVDHLDLYGRLVLAPAGQEGGHDPHASLFGELDRVARQVDDGLPQAGGVGEDRFGIAPGYSIERRDAASSARGRTMLATSANSATTLHGRISTESLPASIFDRSRMSLIRVQQMLPVAMDHGRVVVPAAGAECRIHQEVGIAEDGGHGGADFVAHAGQEPALGLIGRFGLATRLDQLADVDHVQQHAVVFAVPVDRLHAQDDFRAAEGPLEHEGVGADLVAKAVDPMENALRDVARVEVFHAPAEDFASRLAQETAEILVDLDNDIVGVGENDAFFHSGDHRPQFRALVRCAPRPACDR